jgi:Alpha amylase, catalytic domain
MPTSENPGSGQRSLRPHPHLCEINTWAWLEGFSAQQNRLVRLGDVADQEWDRLADLGFDVIWLMGIWQRSPESRRIAQTTPSLAPGFDRALPGWKSQDVVGSPYAVAAYVPDPRVGTWDELDEVRKKLAARGMALFLDFVGNHTARDHRWVREHPEYYVQGSQQDFQKDPSSFFLVETPKGPVFLALARDPYFPPWTDVVQLNHFSAEMRAAQLAEFRNIAGHCDGLRCDMAMLLLHDVFQIVWGRLLGNFRAPQREFWTEAHAAAPQLTLLGEVYWGLEQRLLDLGFSFVYDKTLYDALRDSNISDVHAHVAAPVEYQRHMARFLENHDERRCLAVFSAERLPSVASFMGTLPGMRFYHYAELAGGRIFLPVALRMAAPEPPNQAAVDFFKKILFITKQDAFHQATWSLLQVNPEGDSTSGNLVAFEWRAKDSWKVIAINLAGSASQGRIPFGGRPLPAQQYDFRDELDGIVYRRPVDELLSRGLFVRRDGFGAHIFNVSPV